MSWTYERVIETFETASEENRVNPMRVGQVVWLPEEGEMWLSGDMHDHRRNFEKLIRAADLPNHPERSIILQELIHGDYFEPDGSESSWQTLFKAADLKCDFPDQVHFILANHDLAQIYGEGILKGGASVCEAFTKGVMKEFGDHSERVEVAIKDFLLSMPLAIRTRNGLFCCHSLPTDQQIDAYDYSVFHRELVGADYARRTGAVYQLIWGRNMSPATAAKFAAAMEANFLVTGHQPQEAGYSLNGDQHLIIASDHNRGMFLRFNLTQGYDPETLVQSLIPFAGIEFDDEETA